VDYEAVGNSSHLPLLRLLQLVSPALPVGAYSYSEGLETLVQQGKVIDLSTLKNWLVQELCYGAIRLEAAVSVRAYQAIQSNNLDALENWNHWLSAFRETEELREQSWQMGRSLARLLQDLQPQTKPLLQACGEPCNFAIVFALAAAHWQIDCETSVVGYLQSWAANLVNAGVRLVPLGQTQGQRLLLELHPQLQQTATEVLTLTDDQLQCCSWGVSIASMNHETLYSRLFRS
jgi:urease accessory protein